MIKRPCVKERLAPGPGPFDVMCKATWPLVISGYTAACGRGGHVGPQEAPLTGPIATQFPLFLGRGLSAGDVQPPKSTLPFVEHPRGFCQADRATPGEESRYVRFSGPEWHVNPTAHTGLRDADRPDAAGGLAAVPKPSRSEGALRHNHHKCRGMWTCTTGPWGVGNPRVLPTSSATGGGRVVGVRTRPLDQTGKAWGRGERRGPEGGGGGGGSRPHPEARDYGHRPYLRVTTGPVELRLSGRKAYRTVDRPRTPPWHAREGDAAVPVCVARVPAGSRHTAVPRLAWPRSVWTREGEGGRDALHCLVRPTAAHLTRCRGGAGQGLRSALVLCRSICAPCSLCTHAARRPTPSPWRMHCGSGEPQGACNGVGGAMLAFDTVSVVAPEYPLPVQSPPVHDGSLLPCPGT